MPLHPQSQEFINAIAVANAPGWSDMPLAEARQTFCELGLFGNGPQLECVRDASVGQIPIRIYQKHQHNNPAVVAFFHGGGWVLGDLETHDTLCRRLAYASDCCVVAVHYRRAPEARYPAALHDCFQVVEEIAAGHVVPAADPTRIVLAGDSAGGNLVAAVSMKARDNGFKLAGQVLMYPALATDFTTDSYRDFATGHGLTSETMQWFWAQYLNETTTSDPLAAPLLAQSLQDLPPTHIMTAEYDVLRCEGELFAQRLQEAGVTTSLRRYDGMLHGFIHFSEVFDDAHVAVRDCAQVIQQMTSDRGIHRGE